MTFTPHGKHLIAGDWVANTETFASAPVSGPSHQISQGSPELIDRAVQAAEAAFESYAATSREERARFLEAIADEIEARGPSVTEIGTAETGLPAARLEGERGRTCGQLRLFASHIRAGDYLDRRHDVALPDRAPLPRPDMRMIQMPVGPVGVFGASNFPLAFSTAGGDTASALAAGCPVVVKGHPAHPGTGEIIAEAILAAIKSCGMNPGVFSLVQASNFETGGALVKHPLITAVGFTGSLGAGRALYDMCAARPVPIPFYGELGSINPIFLLPEAAAARGKALGEGWAGSLTMGAGQFCTNPGVAVALKGTEAAFAEAATAAMSQSAPQVMLTDGIASAYRDGAGKLEAADGVATLSKGEAPARNAAAALYRTTARNFLANPALAHEIFGPLGLLVVAETADEAKSVARALDGQLTCTLLMDEGDNAMAEDLLPILARKAGRILANGFPTGVEVADSMVHGGPYPASTNFGATSVGTMAIRRFLRPVCFQNIPEPILPADLRD